MSGVATVADRRYNLRVQPNRLERSLRATFTGLAVNVFLSAVKLIAGIVGHSHALVADACESLADIFSSIIVWRGVVVAAAPADEDHPYGHGKAEPLAAAVVSAILLFVAGWIAIEALHDIGQPRPAPKVFTLLVLLGVIVIKEILFRFVSREADSVESAAVRADAWHHRSDAVTVAAAIGISHALIGGEKFAWADDAAAMAAAGVIAFNGWRLLRSTLSDLMDTAPDREIKKKSAALRRKSPRRGGRGKMLCPQDGLPALCGHARGGGPADDRAALARDRARGEGQDPRGHARRQGRAGAYRAVEHSGAVEVKSFDTNCANF
jgi:cation diffusion facilitator family transporter